MLTVATLKFQYFIVLAILLNRQRTGVKASVCPTGAQQVGRTCLKYHEGSYSWSSARQYCKTQYGIDLLVVRDNAVFSDIQKAVQNRGDHGFWVGATRKGGGFKWVDDSQCCGNYWNPEEPNGVAGSGDDCVHIWNDGSAKGFNDNNCDDAIGFICEECPEIANCSTRHCTNIYDTQCDSCNDNNVFYKRTTSNTKCERLCSFDKHACWPGICSDGLTSSCTCAPEFQAVKSSSQTICQLKASTLPSINTCQTVIGGANGEAKQTTAGKCHELKDFYGNFQPTSLRFEMHSDFYVNITEYSNSRPVYISEEMFGITDTTLFAKLIQIDGAEQILDTFKQKTDVSQSTKATSTEANNGKYPLPHPKYTLTNGERLCIQYQAQGGGYVKRKDFRGVTSTVLSPLPYDKTSAEETICYRFDDKEPQHCLESGPCLNAETEPIQIADRIVKSSTIFVTFYGWTDPLPNGGKESHASGIESYEITVNEVSNGIVDTKKVFNKKMGPSNTSLMLNLTSDSPRLYAINLEVKDVADNVRQARRFILYDATTNISSRHDNPFLVTSASKVSNYVWQTHHNDICLDWKGHFYNRFYMENSLLGKIKPDAHGLISGIYEQETGLLPVSGTPNVDGIIQFMFTWSLNEIVSPSAVAVPDFLNQSYCHAFSVKDGQTYTLNIEAIDIVKNTFSENRTVHIDRTAPHINNIWLTKHGEKRLYVHDETDLSKMNLTFEALDPHSGLLNIEWQIGTMDSGQQLGAGVIGIAAIDTENCPKNLSSRCYCPDVGKCEHFTYSIPLNKLVQNNTHIGNHNRNYLFTIKVTNNARLSNIEHVDVLVDDSPPERGVMYEGAIGSRDIDYTSDDSFIVRWHGFIDHESGIKEYRLGLADVCLSKEELFAGGNNNNITEYTTVFSSESSIRLNANFTGRKFASIIAINNAMEASDVACSDGITRDISPPSIQNLRLENGKWAETLFCFNGETWLLRSDLKRMRLPDTDSCSEHCTNNTIGDFSRILPVELASSNDTSISDFFCQYLRIYDIETVIYVPNDNILLSWDRNEGFSQIEDYFVGFGETSTKASALSIMDYKSTQGKQYFHTRHHGVGSGNLFYAHIKTLSKAKLETVSIIGPIMIDETPPYFREKPVVNIEGDSILVGWSNDTIDDVEQTERINRILFEIVHDGVLASPLLEWTFDDSKPCPEFTGGCFTYPLKRLQRMDTDLGLNFTVKVYAYNNAGHFTLIETEPFSIPSRYPPGHAIVVDIDPEKYSDDLDKDVDVHFTANKVCVHWYGFKHHENVSVEIGLGTSKTDANVIPYQRTNESRKACIQSTDILFDIQYFVLLRASCSGGITISTSNGISIMNETDLLQNLNIALGEHYEDIELINAVSANASENQKCSSADVQIGKNYQLILINVPENVSVVSNDIGVNERVYNISKFKLEMNITPFIKRPCIMIDSRSDKNMSASLRSVKVDEIIIGSKRLPVSWSYGKIDTLRKLNFKIALVAVSNDSLSFGNITHWKRSRESTAHIFELNSYPADRVYTIVVMPCNKIHCLDYVFSHTFQIEHAIHPGEIKQSTITINGGKKCVDIRMAWRQFQALSKITIYQWYVSRDRVGNTKLTSWKTVQNDGRNDNMVNECVNLPVHGHSTLFLCMKAYSEVGNTKTNCQIASTEIETEFSRDTVYDIDVTSNTWGTIEGMIHSSNIGTKFNILHDAEIDFGKTESVIAGVLLHATERNVTWYLMKHSHVPLFAECSKDTECVHSQTSGVGFMAFDSDIIKRNRFHYICAYSNSTSISRETFTEKLPEIRSCSNGFVLDDTPPTAGVVTVRNTNGFLTHRSSVDISWTGFDDNIDVETLGYVDRLKHFSYSIGTRIGGCDIQNYTIAGGDQGTTEEDISVADGTDVYVTIKAFDQAGLSVTATSKRLVVDTTPPVTGTVIINDERDMLAYVNSAICSLSLYGFKDIESGIGHFELGLGTDEDSEDIMSGIIYQQDHFYLKLPESLFDGHKYYVLVKAINRAGLSAGYLSVPFVLDRSPPVGGHVIDGDWNLKKDVDYQSSLGYIQGHWNGFIDPQSGIKYYKVGLGTRPQADDIENMVNVGLRTDILWNGTYHIGKKYYITVEACNTAELCRTISSDGILLDNSPPIQGIVRVGSGDQHKKYLPQSNSVHVQWAGFEDPQSGIDHYETCLGTRPGTCDILPYSTSLLESSIIRTGLNLNSGLDMYASVTVFNKAGMNVASSSDAFQIDITPPEVVQKPSFSSDFNAISGEKAQWEKSVLRFFWKFNDKESKIASHIISLKTHHEGHTPVENLRVGDVDRFTLNLDEKNWLHIGDIYYVVVTSCNVAGLCSSARSDNLLIDSTPPHQGGFKPPLSWQTFVDSKNKTISRITVNWYGFIDVESSVDAYYLSVSRNYSGHELSDGVVFRNASHTKDENATLTLTEQVRRDELLILTIWAKNTAGLNSTVAKISVSALLAVSVSASNSIGILEIQKHSCDIHFCNKDCTCAVLGKQCVDVETNDTCTALNKSDIAQLNFPELDVFGGLQENPYNITASSACLSGHWMPRTNEYMIQRFEWSMGIKDQPIGEGIFDLKKEHPWRDVGKETQTVYCLQMNNELIHNTYYVIYVRAWYSKHMYGTFSSKPIIVDQTPPTQSRGRFIKDSDNTCNKDFDIIDWMDRISGCWNGVFRENQGKITHYTFALGTSENGSDIYPKTNVGHMTNITLTNLTLSHGTKYFFTVTAYNNVGLQTTVSSDGFTIDMDTPIEGVVFNTERHSDMSFQSSTENFSISWHGFLDSYSGIREYYVAIVDNSQTDFTNVSFTNVRLNTKHTFRSLHLEHGKYYKGIVKAFDNAGHASNIVASNAKMIDSTPPSGLSCTEFEKEKVNLTFENDYTAAFISNLSIDNYYVVTGKLSNISFENMPIISVGRHRIYLPLAINNNDSADFEYNFISSQSGLTTISISTEQASGTQFPIAVDTQLLRCISLIRESDDHSAVVVKQIGSSRIAVDCLIMDKESLLYKVHLGAGTTPGGFQIRPLSRLHSGTSDLFDADVEHDALVYVTVIAENHAGLKSVFKAYPVRVDKTAPYISDIETTVTVNSLYLDGNNTDRTVDIFASWNAEDNESGIKYCLCGLGKTVQGMDIQNPRLSNTNGTCLFNNLNMYHGDTSFLSVKCINNIEMASSAVSKEIVISTSSPNVTHASVHIMSASEILQLNPVAMSKYLIATYAQTDRSRIQVEWGGFSDPSGLRNYEYRVLLENSTITDWKTTGGETMAVVTGLSLDIGKLYVVEIRAINSGEYTSGPVSAGVIVLEEPALSGESMSFVRNNPQLIIDWSKVFLLEGNLQITYDVTIGTRLGFSDVVELRQIYTTHYEIEIPRSTIITPNINELFISITCTYSTGLMSVYNANYKL